MITINDALEIFGYLTLSTPQKHLSFCSAYRVSMSAVQKTIHAKPRASPATSPAFPLSEKSKRFTEGVIILKNQRRSAATVNRLKNLIPNSGVTHLARLIICEYNNVRSYEKNLRLFLSV
jgi:hypothetical protein